YLDATPSHSYLKALYKYPQREYPYSRLVDESGQRGRRDVEFELVDTGTFDDDRYFDVFIEYAKAGPTDVLMLVTAHNRGPAAAPRPLLPHVWYRNTWSWDRGAPRPNISPVPGEEGEALLLPHPGWLDYRAYFDGTPEFLFCENETNPRRLYNSRADG